jgi:TPR repeat protein
MKKLLLGLILLTGISLGADEYKKNQIACNGGDAKACNTLGSLYDGGYDYKQAIIYYKKACDGGNADGCANLGKRYEPKAGTQKQYATSIKL